MAILNRDLLTQMGEQLTGPKEELVELLPDIYARIVQLNADAGFALASIDDEGKTQEEKNKLSTFRWVAACCVDENGEQIFTVKELGRLPFEWVKKMANVVYKVNGIATSDAVREAEKNSEQAP